MSAKELGSDNRPHEEMIEIKDLLKVLIQSQTKLAEAQAQQAKSQENIQKQMLEQAKSQENIQNQMLEVLRSNSAGNQQQEAQVNIQNQMLKFQENLQNQMLEQAKSQENIQNQMIEVLRSNGAGTKQQDDQDDNHDDDHDDVKDDDDDDDDDDDSDIVDENRVVRVAEYNPDRNQLLIEGDCEETIEFLRNNPEAFTQGVTPTSDTVLQLAIQNKREMKLIMEIVNLMPPESLEYKSADDGSTALHFAAVFGNAEAVVLIANKNPRLHLIVDDDVGRTPLDMAICSVTVRQKEIVEYLYSVTIDGVPSLFSNNYGADLLCRLIEANFYDMALCLIKRFPEYVNKKSEAYKVYGLEMIVRRPFAFRSGTKLSWWQDIIYSLIHVDMNTPCIQQVEPNKCQCSKCTLRDEENPLPESLNCTKLEESSKVFFSSTDCKAINMTYLTRAIGIEGLYRQKMVHQQAIALTKQMLSEFVITDKAPIIDFLKDNPNIMEVAIKHGITEFIAECLEKFDYLIWKRIAGDKTMMPSAITERKEFIVNLICETGDKVGERIRLVSKVDTDGNTLLHYAARLAPSAQLNLVSGAALRMQREVQWFKGVESMLRESDRFKRNKKGETAHFIFREAHNELVKEGREWLKDTSGSCMIVGALITTVSFAAAFTVPGGNISDTNSALNGTPIFLGKPSFAVFAVADALALISSITSVLMFLAIYTSRFGEMDFLKSLPQKLIFGLATLFVSMVAILVAFGASLFIVVGSRFAQALLPITLISCFPLGLFAWLQLPLFVEMVRSTYWGVLFKKHRYIDPSTMKDANKSRKKKKEH